MTWSSQRLRLRVATSQRREFVLVDYSRFERSKWEPAQGALGLATQGIACVSASSAAAEPWLAHHRRRQPRDLTKRNFVSDDDLCTFIPDYPGIPQLTKLAVDVLSRHAEVGAQLTLRDR